MADFILFCLTFLLVLCLYELFIVKKYLRDDTSSKKKNDKDPFEITYLVKRYHLDMEKISYNQLLQLVAIISSFDISLIVSIILLIDSFIFKVLIGFICTLVIIIVSYHFVYLFYKKKGMVKNEL